MASSQLSRRRHSVAMPPMSSSSSVTLVNSPKCAGSLNFPADGFGHKRRKSVTFSSVTHVVHYPPVDRSNISDKVDHQTRIHLTPISTPHADSRPAVKAAAGQSSTPTSHTPSSPHRNLISPAPKQSQSDEPPQGGLNSTSLSGTGSPTDVTSTLLSARHFHSPSEAVQFVVSLVEPLQSPSPDRTDLSPYSQRRQRAHYHRAQHEARQKSHQPTSLFITTNTYRLPPPHICAQVNNEVRTTFCLPGFDFVEHLRRRKYVVRKRHFEAPSPNHCVTVLDASVDLLIPSTADIPTSRLPFAHPQTLFDIQPAFASSPSHYLENSKLDAISKGLGMFALLPIPVNATIVVERPALIMPYVTAFPALVEEAFESGLRMLDDETKTAIMDLARSPQTREVKSVYDAILKVNSLPITLTVPSKEENGPHGELETHKGIFLKTSSINHSCSPNAKWEWDLKTFSLLVKSVRAIASGEEITISYVSPLLPYHLRREALFSAYSFHCTCDSCVGLAGRLTSNPDIDLRDEVEATARLSDRIEQSNTARKMLVHFWNVKGRPSFKEWCEDLTLPADLLIKAHTQALELLQREGLGILDTYPGSYPPTWPKFSHISDNDIRIHPLRDLGRHIDVIAMCYGALEDVDNFMLWIRKVAEARGFNLDAPSGGDRSRPVSLGLKDERLVFVKWITNPLSFPVWGWRAKGIKREAHLPNIAYTDF
ncbi:hypothetical protein CPB84DRAFT_1750156 [Gymnopilus junonius]|uniref:SET domain-containing protein n=1 Tax=Gymnopilus junonius TaxID=109634 RepID=A0A9P5TKE2_GYMJU|nr:hypothetical protein CPB84DRAFT_1750156 [Gymnopilus junonius]